MKRLLSGHTFLAFYIKSYNIQIFLKKYKTWEKTMIKKKNIFWFTLAVLAVASVIL